MNNGEIKIMHLEFTRKLPSDKYTKFGGFAALKSNVSSLFGPISNKESPDLLFWLYLYVKIMLRIKET